MLFTSRRKEFFTQTIMNILVFEMKIFIQNLIRNQQSTNKITFNVVIFSKCNLGTAKIYFCPSQYLSLLVIPTCYLLYKDKSF